MKRREFLTGGAGVVGATAVAGCAGLFKTTPASTGIPPVPSNRPDGIYVPSHIEGMEMVGMDKRGDYAFGLMYSYAHRFWNVNGDSISLTEIQDGDDVHLMATVWDPETAVVLPDTGLSIEIVQDGSVVSQETIYPMLSQPMGFHYGANFGLEGDGSYTVELSVGGMTTRRTGSFRDTFSDPATGEITFEYSQSDKEEIMFERKDDSEGSRGAVDPMSMEMMPNATVPAANDLPGTVHGTVRSNDADLTVTGLTQPPDGLDGDGQYLAVSARSRYNEMLIPAMQLAGTLSRDGETIYEGPLTRTLDPDLHYHYGAVVDSLQSGDELTIRPQLQPQTARHEGYETAFGGLKGGMPDKTLEL